MSEDDTRRFEMELEVDAPPDVTWRALTDAAELARWFPLEARVTPGVGGSIWVSWGEGWQGEMAIEIWEPEKRLRLSQRQPRPYDIDGRPVGDAPAAPVPLFLDYHLEGKGGRTVLRLVHSGFGRGKDWDDEFDSIRHGWKFEMGGLRHYLARHRGQDRRVAWSRAVSGLPLEEAWARLSGPRGFGADGVFAGRGEGAAYRVRSALGDVFEGTVKVDLPPRDFAGTVPSWNDAYLRLGLEHFGGQTSFNVFLATWGVPAERLRDVEERNTRVLRELAEASPSAR